ncbi:Uncharacterized protein TCAP_00182 [Tolypocladium capitatum]|uniref:Uncharacterized protein n=1 Tax=Tolypocladium capitatum TaxID=45235 RepID=A0A2K3QQV4_9HYPO|nr:Uncharacterized protein TCAP_00182 [Tolypocladium capitatum]
MSGTRPRPVDASPGTRRTQPVRALQPVAMTVEDSIQDICIDKPRCGLCQFQIQDDESVVAVLGDDRASAPFCFRRGGIYEDEEIGIAFHMCCRSRCIRRSRRVPCLHNGCYSFKLFPISSDFLAATDYDFSPPIRFDLQRQDRIKWKVARKLKLGFLRKMPQELCYLVAEYITQELAAITCQDLARDVHPSNSTIDLARDVYAIYVSIEGISYLQSLHSSPPGGDGRGQRIHDSRQGHVIRTIYVAYDHLGVRSVRFGLPNSDLPSLSRDCCGVWWTELARNSGLAQVTTQSNFYTSQERAVMFGRYILHPKVQLQSHRIYATSNSPSRIYFNAWDPVCDDKWIKYWGVDSIMAETDRSKTQDKVTHWNPYPPSLKPSSPPPYTQYNEPWYYTNCRLEDAVEITCCTDKAASHKPIIGMLISYGNGRRACVGQYRMDWATDTFTVNPSRRLRIGLGKTRRNLPYVANVSLRGLATPDSDSLSWIDIPWHGKLEWWFSHRQCKLCYSD